MMSIIVTIIYYGMFAFIVITVVSILYKKFKPLIDTVFPKKTWDKIEADCPNCFVRLRKTKKGFECDNCGFIDEFLEKEK